ncbi:DUF5816 domain-containing protein [Haladaptatus halobius]|uniref:DUF5816 domain-containing protein n=1 Tax=Haladaptatus halobius TaxID=2884875 RepID=UPI001D0A1C78
MGVLDQLKTVLGTKEESRYGYRCMNCQNTFKSREEHMARVSCQMCGSNNVRGIA